MAALTQQPLHLLRWGPHSTLARVVGPMRTGSIPPLHLPFAVGDALGEMHASLHRGRTRPVGLAVGFEGAVGGAWDRSGRNPSVRVLGSSVRLGVL